MGGFNMKHKLLITLLILLVGVLGLMSLVSANVVWRVVPSDFVWNEDNVNIVDLNDYVTSDKGSVVFTLDKSKLEHITVTQAGSILTLVPDTNWHGMETLTVTAKDSDNVPVSTVINLVVNPVGIIIIPPGPGSDFIFRSVKVDGAELSVIGSNVVSFERGNTIEVKIELSTIDPKGNKDVRIRGWIGGYEFDDVSDETEIFDMSPGVRYLKTLYINIPEDIDVGNSLESSEFALHLEAFDKKEAKTEQKFTLKIDKIRHKLNVLDVIFYPSNTVEPGRALRAVVRVENLGQKKEEDILVRVSIPDLGVSTRTYIDELTANELDNEDEEDSSSSRDLVLYIPQDARPGEYDVETSVEFSRGHETVTKRSTILVQGVASVVTPPSSEVPKAIISIDTTTQDVAQGSEVLYKVMVANLGKERALYTVTVEGEGAWATSRISPSFISVDPNQAGESFVYIKSNENAPLGQQSFRVNVLSNGNVVKSLDLRSNVVAKGGELGNLGILKNGLEISFVVLIAVLIILGLVIAFRRVSSGESRTKAEEPSDTIGEGQTYY